MTLLLLVAYLIALKHPDQVDEARALVQAMLQSNTEDMVVVPGGSFRPLYAASRTEQRIQIHAFFIDRSQVTNAEFLRFVTLHPDFRKNRISRLFADGGYLAGWAGPLDLGSAAAADAPVVDVSWFAAKTYCESRHARLPFEAEWEYAAAASETLPDARRDAAWRARILDWYAHPANSSLRAARSGKPNYFGVRNLHGLVWEWVLDFNSTLVSSDSRNTSQPDNQAFCGAGALNASDSSDYGAFMREALRGSLRGDYTGRALGFRCARDQRGEK